MERSSEVEDRDRSSGVGNEAGWGSGGGEGQGWRRGWITVKGVKIKE
jgi:hypothetical protein